MSRHKIVKNLDLDDELDDYDGGDDNEDEGGDGMLQRLPAYHEAVLTIGRVNRGRQRFAINLDSSSTFTRAQNGSQAHS